MKRRKVILSGVVGYLVAWGLTATVGVSRARADAEMPRDTIREWDGYSPMPGLVLFSHENFCTAYAGSYLWLFGYGRILDRRATLSWYPMF